jgi:cytochrome c biogenesis protein CcmG, thiol:disulfide interchange protein DsbE
MRKLIPLLIIAIAVAALVAGLLLRPGTQATAAPVVGHRAPDFTLPTSNTARDISLSSYRGHVVLLNFFATWCVPCTNEMPQIERAYQAATGKLVVLGIDKQEPAGDVNSLRRALRIRYPLLLDDTLQAWQRYRVSIQPVSFWIDPEGTVRAIHYGPMSVGYMEHELAHLHA